MVWCDDPAPDEHCDPSEAVKYARADYLSDARALAIDNARLRERVAELEHTLEAAAMDYHMASGGDHLFYVAEALDSSNAGGER